MDQPASASDRDFPEVPYPGAAPPWSYVHLDARSHRLRADASALAGWNVGARDLDGWLAERGQAPAAARVPVLTYGSNRCPSKITWLRRELGLPGAVVVLRARTHGIAAVWAAGFRLRDRQRPAVLAAMPGAVEQHSVWLATPGQVDVLDHCEGGVLGLRQGGANGGVRVPGGWPPGGAT